MSERNLSLVSRRTGERGSRHCAARDARLAALIPVRASTQDTFDALMAEFKAAGQLTVPSSQPSALDPAAESRSRGPVPGPPPATLKPARGWSPRASPSDSCKVLPIDDDVSPRDSYTLHPLQKDSLPRPSPRRSPPSLSRPALSDGCSKEERLRTTAPQPTAAWGAPPPPDAATSTREGGARFSIEQPRPEAEARITRDAAVHAYLKYAYYLHHRREMEEIFDRFDLNRDNQLELTELANVLEWIEKRNVVRRHGTFFAMAHEVKVGKHELLQVMRRCDVNANGKIDRAEAIPAMAYWTEYARVRDAEGNSGKCALM